MKILGIDPGLETVGYGVIESKHGNHIYVASGVIKTKADRRTSERLMEIHADVKEILEIYTPEVVAIEKLFFYSNRSSAMEVSQARGVILMALGLIHCEIVEHPPQTIKLQVCGDGRADKKAIQYMVNKILGQDIKEDNSADALAIALTFALKEAGSEVRLS